MYKIYFKQALEMLKQNKFISTISIGGTALAIMMIMVIIVTQGVKTIGVAPESNRSRTLYIKYESPKKKDGTNSTSGPLSLRILRYIYEMQTPELISALKNEESYLITSEDNKIKEFADLKYTDANFWKIMTFSFIEGQAYTEADFKAGLKKIVITESIAKSFFSGTDCVGKTLNIAFEPHTIVGVVKDVSPVFKHAYGDIWAPYTTASFYHEESKMFKAVLLAKSTADFDAIRQETREIERKYSSTDEEYNLILRGPYTTQTELIDAGSDRDPDERTESLKYMFILLILILIPAINLFSFSMSRIKKRTEEIGVRKAFGAKKYIILVQVLYENMITSLIGGIIGLILSFGVVVWLKEWLLGVEEGSAIPIQTLISPWTFIAVFLVCLVFNLLSAGIPAYRASRIVIIDSLNQNED